MKTKEVIEGLQNIQSGQSNVLLDIEIFQANFAEFVEKETLACNSLHLAIQQCIETLKEVSNAKS